MDHNAVLEATKHHDPYAQAMEELNCATEGLTASIHQVMDLERQRQRKKTHLNRIKASKRRFPIPNYPITQLPYYPITQLPTLPFSTAQTAPKCFKYLSCSVTPTSKASWVLEPKTNIKCVFMELLEGVCKGLAALKTADSYNWP
jgi:hypothetical protein